jgi:hypothetical protein
MELKLSQKVRGAHFPIAHLISDTILYTSRSPAATKLLADAFNARDSLRIMLNVADFSPFSMLEFVVCF